ncbi:MAG: hypothetical protein ACRDCH_00945 [Metamycoplasmataceae bacterium]
MKLKYIPGLRPTPMLMYQNIPNNDVFQAFESTFKKGNYTEDQNHIWNIGSYIIYNDHLEITAYRISNEYNFLWLLRVINKEIILELQDDFVKEHQKFLLEVSDELIPM